MDVKKIFILLITVVACIMVGAFILNVIMPNTLATVFDAVDGAIYSATGISLDLNGNNKAGNAAKNVAEGEDQTANAKYTNAGIGKADGNNVNGYKKGKKN